MPGLELGKGEGERKFVPAVTGEWEGELPLVVTRMLPGLSLGKARGSCVKGLGPVGKRYPFGGFPLVLTRMLPGQPLGKVWGSFPYSLLGCTLRSYPG